MRAETSESCGARFRGHWDLHRLPHGRAEGGVLGQEAEQLGLVNLHALLLIDP